VQLLQLRCLGLCCICLLLCTGLQLVVCGILVGTTFEEHLRDGLDPLHGCFMQRCLAAIVCLSLLFITYLIEDIQTYEVTTSSKREQDSLN
jgi:hypothetical protein